MGHDIVECCSDAHESGSDESLLKNSFVESTRDAKTFRECVGELSANNVSLLTTSNYFEEINLWMDQNVITFRHKHSTTSRLPPEERSFKMRNAVALFPLLVSKGNAEIWVKENT